MIKLWIGCGVIGFLLGASAVRYDVVEGADTVAEGIETIAAGVYTVFAGPEEPEIEPISDKEVAYLTAGVERVIEGEEKGGITDELASLTFDREADVMVMTVHAHSSMPDEMAHRRTLSYTKLLTESPAGSDEFTFDVEVYYEHVDEHFAHDVQYIRDDEQYKSSESDYLDMWLNHSS